MSKIKEVFQNFIKTTNWDGIRCMIKGDPSIREIIGALKRQKEIEKEWVYIFTDNEAK